MATTMTPPPTSKPYSELDDILDMYFPVPYQDYNMGLLPDEDGYDYVQLMRKNNHLVGRDEAKQRLLAWSAEQVRAARQDAYEDVSSKGGNGALVRQYAKTRAFQLAQLTPKTTEEGK